MKKIKLFNNISALYKMNVKFGETNIYIKRDDTLDFAFGGNKVRLFEYIAELVIRRNIKKIITFGSIYSNHIRVAAATANYLGISADLIVLLKKNQKIYDKANFKLINHHKDINLIKCFEDEAHDFIEFYLEKQNKIQKDFLWIPGGGHMPEAAFGYIDAAKEIYNQLKSIACKIDAIFLPTGTGTTQAGLIYGLSGKIPIYGVTVARSIERCKSEILNLLNAINNLKQSVGGGY